MKNFFLVTLVVIGAIIWGGVIYLLFSGDKPPAKTNTSLSLGSVEMKKFASAEEFKAYLKESTPDLMSYYGFAGSMRSATVEDIGGQVGLGTGVPEAVSAEPSRVSATNVQVLSIDEPDYVKTDGKNIFYSPKEYYYGRGMEIFIDPIDSSPSSAGATQIIKAFPVSDLEKLSEINQTGEMLLFGDRLIIFASDSIYGYDLSLSESPKEVWRWEIEAKSQRVSSRLYQGKIYLVTSTYVEEENPCPIEPLKSGRNSFSVGCTEIYYPGDKISADVTYTALVINPKDGKVENSVSFIGDTES